MGKNPTSMLFCPFILLNNRMMELNVCLYSDSGKTTMSYVFGIMTTMPNLEKQWFLCILSVFVGWRKKCLMLQVQWRKIRGKNSDIEQWLFWGLGEEGVKTKKAKNRCYCNKVGKMFQFPEMSWWKMAPFFCFFLLTVSITC